MKRQDVFSLLTFSLLLGGVSQAAPVLESSSTPLEAIEPAQETTISGEIRSVDKENKSFTLVDGDKVHAIKVGDKTKITLDGEEVPAADALKKGRRVEVVKDGNEVKSIAVTSEIA